MSEQDGSCFSISEDFRAAIDRLRRFLNQAELAERWRLSERTIEKWRSTGRGPQHLKLGRRVVYRLEDIERFEIENIRKSRQGAGR
jgi:predicted DNA-binding transcriptional regulator AlpA